MDSDFGPWPVQQVFPLPACSPGLENPLSDVGLTFVVFIRLGVGVNNYIKKSHQ